MKEKSNENMYVRTIMCSFEEAAFDEHFRIFYIMRI